MIAQKSVIRYNLQLKTWQVINGKVRSFGAGKHNKRRALRYALGPDQPELQQAVINFAATYGNDDNEGQLMDRLLKAASLISKGRVYDNGRVASQSDPDATYTTRWAHNGWCCDCPDFDNGLLRQVGLSEWGGVLTSQGLHCKHTLAQELAERLGLDLPGEPIPF
jgi:hypothetical protein